MKPVGMILIAVCALASCGRAPDAANNGSAAAPIMDNVLEDPNAASANAAANVAEPARDRAADETAIRAAIDHVYAAYSTPSGPVADPAVSPDLKTALDKAEARDETGLGYDPWCDCQDFDDARFAYTVRTVQFAPDGDHARVSLLLDLGFAADGAGRVRKWVAFVRTSRGWLIDDLSDADGKSMKAAIRAAPAAPALPVIASNATG